MKFEFTGYAKKIEDKSSEEIKKRTSEELSMPSIEEEPIEKALKSE